MELIPPYVDTGLDAEHRAQNIEAQGGEGKAMKPMPLEEYLDTVMVGFKQGEKEVATGFSQMGASAWRKAYDPVLERLGINA